MQQPSLALQQIAESLAPPRHKRSTEEVFNEPQRLHKVLASCGFGSRRAMEELILAGRITVNRMPAEIGQKVGPGDEVRINGEPVKIRFAEPRPRILVYHKPAGELVTRDDPEERATVFEGLPPIHDGKWIAVGRLDYNTEGLLLFTNSGELANRLMHPRYEVEREYAVRVMGRLSDEQIRQLTTGVELDDGPAKCDTVEDGGGEEEGANHWYRVVLKEGRNREVRRLFEALGLTVSRLIRTRYGKVAMPAAVKRAQTLELEPHEVGAVLSAVGLKAQGGGNGGGAASPGQQPAQPGQPGQKPRHGSGKGRGNGRGPGPKGQGQGHGQGPRPQGQGQGQPQGQGPHPRAGQGPGQGQGHGQGQGQGRRHGKPGGRPGFGKPGGGRPYGQGQGAGQRQGQPGMRGEPGNSIYSQPQLTSHSQPQLTSHMQPHLTLQAPAQPHLTMHGRRGPEGQGQPQGAGGNNRKRRRGKGPGGAGAPVKQKWEGLPKDEDEGSAE